MDGNGERVDMMKVLVTGADGMLGRDVMRALREKHVNARGVDVADFDVTDGAAVREWVTAEQPDAIIHLAAYTDLLKAETEPAKCIDVNAMGTLNMVRAALAIGAKLMLMSSSEVLALRRTLSTERETRRAPRTFTDCRRCRRKKLCAR